MERKITVPDMIMWTATRIALGTGIGMLVGRNLSKDALKTTGIALTAVGAFTTIPLMISMLSKKNAPREIRSVA